MADATRSPVTAIIATIAGFMVLAVIVYQITAPHITPPPIAPVQPPNGSVAMSYDAKIQQLKLELEAVYTGRQPGEVSLTLDEAEVNEAIGRLIAQAGTQISMQVNGLVVDLRPGNIAEVNLFAVTFGISYTVKVVSTIQVKDGSFDVQANTVEVPLILAAYKESVASLVREQTRILLKQLIGSGLGYDGKVDLRYTGVQTDDSTITIKARASPAA